MAFTMSCPHCAATLKTATEVPSGKKLQCPKCKEGFVTGQSESISSASGATKQPVPMSSMKKNRPEADLLEEDGEAPAGNAFADFDSEPAPKKKKRDDDTEADDEPKSRRSRSQGRDDDDDDDRPRSKKPIGKGKGKKKEKDGNNSKMIMIIGGAVLGIGVIVAAIFMLGGGGGMDKELMAYLPADSDVVGSVNVAAIMGQSDLKSMIDSNTKNGPANELLGKLGQAGLKLEDFDKIVFGGNQQSAAPVVVIKTKKDFDPQKITNALSAQEANAGGKKFYKFDDWKMFMPSNSVIVMTKLPESQMTALIGKQGGNLALPDKLRSLADQASSGDIWFAMSNSQQGMGMPKTLPGGGKPNGAYLSLRIGSSLDISGGVRLEGGDASKAASDYNSQWNDLKGAANLFLGSAPPGVKTLVKEVTDSLSISSSGDFITASLSMRVDTIKNAANGGLPGGMNPLDMLVGGSQPVRNQVPPNFNEPTANDPVKKANPPNKNVNPMPKTPMTTPMPKTPMPKGSVIPLDPMKMDPTEKMDPMPMPKGNNPLPKGNGPIPIPGLDFNPPPEPKMVDPKTANPKTPVPMPKTPIKTPVNPPKK